jgi:CubicO group peptidase (beta-lactamase class C family)
MAADFNSLSRLVDGSTEDRVIPGAVLAVGQAGAIVFLQAFGHRQVDPSVEKATRDTVYDLASLTKALVTSVLAMKAVARGLIDLDAPLGDQLEAMAHRPQVTLRRVLAHAGGFPAHRKFYEDVATGALPSEQARAAILAAAAAEPQAYQPGTRSVYSDLGFMLLGELLEARMSARLDTLAEGEIFRPLGLASIGFVDLLAAPGATRFGGHDVAPTERCPVRGRLIRGEVHDLNAYAMGGVAGHAGLFGTASDVLEIGFALCAAYRKSGPNGGAPIVDPEVLRLFWQPAGIPGSTWRLGWDGPAATGSLAGDLLSKRAVGHLSFTGCSLWIDPEQEVCIALLTNRVHPSVRDDPRFRALRPALHDAALQAIGYRAR